MILYNYGGFVVVAIERQLLHSLAPGLNPGYVITLMRVKNENDFVWMPFASQWRGQATSANTVISRAIHKLFFFSKMDTANCLGEKEIIS